jgi:hypothetical protein
MTAVGYVVKAMTVTTKQGTAAAVSQECAITGIRETPSATTQTTQTACPDGTITDTGPTSWTVDVSYNTSLDPASFHRLLLDHTGEQVTLTWEPDPVNDPGRKRTATVTLVAPASDYTVGSFATATVSLPVRGGIATVDPVAP